MAGCQVYTKKLLTGAYAVKAVNSVSICADAAFFKYCGISTIPCDHALS